MGTLGHLSGPLRFQPHHVTHVAHVYSRQDPVSNTTLAKQLFLIDDVIGLGAQNQEFVVVTVGCV